MEKCHLHNTLERGIDPDVTVRSNFPSRDVRFGIFEACAKTFRLDLHETNTLPEMGTGTVRNYRGETGVAGRERKQ